MPQAVRQSILDFTRDVAARSVQGSPCVAPVTFTVVTNTVLINGVATNDGTFLVQRNGTTIYRVGWPGN